MDGIRDLRLLLASRHPLIVARMDDETRFMSFARRAADLCGYPVWTWSVTLGLARDGNASQVDTQEPKKALAFVRQLQAPGSSCSTTSARTSRIRWSCDTSRSSRSPSASARRS